MKKINHFAWILMAALVVACSGEITVKPTEVALKGDLKDYYKVVDKEYVFTKTDNSFAPNLIAIELTRTSQDFPYDISYAGFVGFGIELLDENGNVVAKKSATAKGLSGTYSDDDIVELKRLSANETGSIRWSFDDEVIKNAKSLRILSSCNW